MSASEEAIRFDRDDLEAEHGVQVAPLIDIVFLLICFYLLVGQLVAGREDPSVQPPAMASPAAGAAAPAELVINVRQDGAVTVGGQAMAPGALRQMLAGELALARRAERPLRVVIRCDRRGRFGGLDEVLKTCRLAGVGQVVFRSLQEEHE